MLIEYDGTAYRGWQVQKNGTSVQGVMEEAMRTLTRQDLQVVGSGRTDAGVHARGQVAHFSVPSPLDPRLLLKSINGLLPKDVAVLHLEPAAADFHARYDAVRRRYHYYTCTEPRPLERHFRLILRPVPDFTLMNDSARFLQGRHHFGAFCRTQSETENRICTIERAMWVEEERPGNWRFEIVADRFLHGMVRAIVGTLLQIGRRRRPAGALAEIVASRDRRFAGPAAPSYALVLELVEY